MCSHRVKDLDFQGQGMIFYGKQIFFTQKSLKLSVGKNILMENFSLARIYLFWCGIAKVTTAPFSEISVPDFGVAKGFTSTLGA